MRLLKLAGYGLDHISRIIGLEDNIKIDKENCNIILTKIKDKK
jgi:hypothetical protein